MHGNGLYLDRETVGRVIGTLGHGAIREGKIGLIGALMFTIDEVKEAESEPPVFMSTCMHEITETFCGGSELKGLKGLDYWATKEFMGDIAGFALLEQSGFQEYIARKQAILRYSEEFKARKDGATEQHTVARAKLEGFMREWRKKYPGVPINWRILLQVTLDRISKLNEGIPTTFDVFAEKVFMEYENSMQSLDTVYEGIENLERTSTQL